MLHLPNGQAIDIVFRPVKIDATDMLMQRGGKRLVSIADRLGHVRHQFCAMLTAPPTLEREGIARPDLWSGNSTFLHARAVFDAKLVFEKDGAILHTIEQLSSDATVFSIIRHYKGQNASRILRGIRPVIRFLGAEFSSRATRAIGRLAYTPRRDENEILPTKQACFRSAWDEFQKALWMMHRGSIKRGQTRLRDAVALAVEVRCAFRRSELVSVDVEMVIENKNVAEIHILVNPNASKVRRLQFGRISDPKIIQMLRELIGSRKNGALFRTNWGSRLAGPSAWAGLRRVGLRSELSFPLNFSKMRRIGVTAEIDSNKQQMVVRHLPGSRVTKVYQMHEDNLMIDRVRKISEEYSSVGDFGPYDKLDRSFRARRVPRSPSGI